MTSDYLLFSTSWVDGKVFLKCIKGRFAVFLFSLIDANVRSQRSQIRTCSFRVKLRCNSCPRWSQMARRPSPGKSDLASTSECLTVHSRWTHIRTCENTWIIYKSYDHVRGLTFHGTLSSTNPTSQSNYLRKRWRKTVRKTAAVCLPPVCNRHYVKDKTWDSDTCIGKIIWVCCL